MASFLSTPITTAEDAIANSTAFRTWCGATSVADAKANYIFSDDSQAEDDLPENYAVIGELEGWMYSRIAIGQGPGSFKFTSGVFNVVFVEDVGDTEDDFTAANRIAFKDSIAGFIYDFMTNFQSAGQRLKEISNIPHSENFPFQGSTQEGRYVYSYGIAVTSGVV